jgi:hypothetical protein
VKELGRGKPANDPTYRADQAIDAGGEAQGYSDAGCCIRSEDPEPMKGRWITRFCESDRFGFGD